MASKRTIHSVVGVATTVGAVTGDIATFTVPDASVIYVEGTLVGRESNGDVASAKISHRFKRVSGTLSEVASAISIASFAAGSDAALATSVIAIVVSGNDIILRVTGVALKTVEWLGELKIYIN